MCSDAVATALTTSETTDYSQMTRHNLKSVLIL